MNIATGGGTLVHEVVHPFIAASFPRRAGLVQRGARVAVRGGRARRTASSGACPTGGSPASSAPSAPAAPDVRGDDRPRATTPSTRRNTGYAQARYLCLYLQEKGLLRRYYEQFSAGAAADPTGYKTLMKVLGDPNMARFEKQWQAWALALELEET